MTDPDLIDCYIYDINAILKRYKYLLDQAAQFTTVTQMDYPISDTESSVTVLT